ncbi:UDP-N-acetylmuramoyl-tripeptide--D-alanyl-D-alanine ligase [Amphibacillus sediminis]|uniref:UDP-N-acetylmuramoyl-tripeptide--D-alanyl-D- alanine ligase n=1 Tax=Amphibacillus sediminis TaxID=360185 RepID=UPI0008368273|nr:UDP-N-acetylmuramoyl-tripeptide--D-alanyl-D-alanine ligase [Amphibacillus sediminis]
MLSFAFLAELFPEVTAKPTEDLNLTGVSTDTRLAMNGALFVPIKGERFDGHDYILQAKAQGAVAALWQKQQPIPDTMDRSFPLFLVEDTLLALQQLAKAYRKLVNPKVIAITGSNGKTTTKDLVTAVCKQKWRTHFTKGNLNNHLGVPLTILSMELDTEVLILEMGMNHFNEIDLLTQLANPDIAIITNIGESHIEHLGSREGIAQAKLEIINGLSENGLLIYDGDEPLLTKAFECQTVSVGYSDSNQVTIDQVEIEMAQTSFTIKGIAKRFAVPLLGKHHAKNASYAIVIGQQLNLTLNQIANGLQMIETTGMRFEKIQGQHGSILINDAYNASPTSMHGAIEVFSQLKGYQRKILVLGDMFELGKHAEAFHREVGAAIPASIDLVCTYGELAKYISQYAPIQAKHFEHHDQLIEYLHSLLAKQTILLFKASRGMKFERFIAALAE